MKKISLAQLKVISFITQISSNDKNTIKGADAGGASGGCVISNRYDVCRKRIATGLHGEGDCTGNPKIDCLNPSVDVGCRLEERSGYGYECTNEDICDFEHF